MVLYREREGEVSIPRSLVGGGTVEVGRIGQSMQVVPLPDRFQYAKGLVEKVASDEF